MRATVRMALLLLFALAGRAVSAPADLEAIRDYLERGMLRTAKVRLAAYVDTSPDCPEGQALLAEVRLVEGEWPGAEAAARRALELGEPLAREWMLWGRARMEQGRAELRTGRSADAAKAWFRQAEHGFRQARAIEPEHPDALWRWGQAREWQGDGATAEQFYEAQIREHPDHPGGYRRLGELLDHRADRAVGDEAPAAAKLRTQALAVFERGLASAGEDAELHHLRAVVLEKQGERAAAVASWERAVRADPDFTSAWDCLGDRVDRSRELVPLAVEVLQRQPTSCAAARIAGSDALSREPLHGEKAWTRFETALEHILPALERNGDHEVLYRLAFRAAQELTGKTPRSAPNAAVAVAAFEKIHEAYVWSGDAANNLGFFFREMRRYEASLAWYLKSVERAPDSQDILNDTGLIYLYHFPRMREKGLPYFEKTLALVVDGDQKPERGYWDALENLAKHYWEVDRRPELVLRYAAMRYETTRGVRPYNMSQVAAGFAAKARQALGE